jgi:hypothetical protein
LAITYDAIGLSALAEAAYRKAVSLNNCYVSYDSLMQTLSWEPHQAEKLQIIADRAFGKQESEVKKESETRQDH